MVFGLKFRKGAEDADHGHLRVVVNGRGEVKEIDLVQALEPHECAPALTEALTATNALSEKDREARLEEVLAAARRSAGVLDRLRGKAKDREAEALAQVPAELFRGEAGKVAATVDGRYAVVLIEVESGTSAAEAVSRAPDAVEAARKKADEGWREAVKKHVEETSEESPASDEE